MKYECSFKKGAYVKTITFLKRIQIVSIYKRWRIEKPGEKFEKLQYNHSVSMMTYGCITQVAFYFTIQLSLFVVGNTMKYLTAIQRRLCSDDIIHISFVPEFSVSFYPCNFWEFIRCHMYLCQMVAKGFGFDHGLDIFMPLVPLDQQKGYTPYHIDKEKEKE
jgi:hypothetical protein